MCTIMSLSDVSFLLLSVLQYPTVIYDMASSDKAKVCTCKAKRMLVSYP